jgi:hypothetical protein
MDVTKLPPPEGEKTAAFGQLFSVHIRQLGGVESGVDRAEPTPWAGRVYVPNGTPFSIQCPTFDQSLWALVPGQK